MMKFVQGKMCMDGTGKKEKEAEVSGTAILVLAT
jgi:hypothetical protein